MTFFMFQGLDRAGAGPLRLRIREDHRVHLRQPFPGCRCVLGGPLTDDDDRMIGTLLVLEADDRRAADGFLARDPYVQNDLFVETRLMRWRWTMGAPDANVGDRDVLGPSSA